MSKGKVVVLGLNGHIGHAVAVAFRDAGWDVAGMARSDRHRTPGIRYVQGDSDSVGTGEHLTAGRDPGAGANRDVLPDHIERIPDVGLDDDESA